MHRFSWNTFAESLKILLMSEWDFMMGVSRLCSRAQRTRRTDWGSSGGSQLNGHASYPLNRRTGPFLSLLRLTPRCRPFETRIPAFSLAEATKLRWITMRLTRLSVAVIYVREACQPAPRPAAIFFSPQVLLGQIVPMDVDPLISMH